MGRGEADPWSCGPPDGTAQEAGTSDTLCAERLQLMGANSTGTDGAGAIEVRNDRRLELQLDMPHFAGPRLDELARVLSPDSAWLADGQAQKVIQHHSVFRHYPAGTTPLHPVRVPLAGASQTVHKACSLPGGDADGGRLWLDTGWQKLTVTPQPADSLPVSWTLEPGLVAPNGAANVLGYHLIVRVRALPEARSTNPDDLGVLELMLATQVVQDGQVIDGTKVRPDLATGVPDPWRIRVRLTSFLDTLVVDPGGTRLNAAQRDLLRSCLGISADMVVDASGADVDQRAARKARLDPVMLQALAVVPRDPAGLLALTHDYHAPTGLFALRPGQHLRLLVGRDQLAPKLAPATNEARADFVDLTSEMVLPLYAAPTRSLALSGEDAMSVVTGRVGADAVTLDPGLSLRPWNLAEQTISSLSERGYDGTFGIGDPAALNLLMAGRLSYVLPPHGAAGQMTRAVPRDFADTSDAGARQRARDTLIVAARDYDAVAAFLARNQFGGIFGEEVNTDSGISLRPACHWGSEPVSDGGTDAPVLCGLFTQPMRASLLIDVTINGETRRVPLGTTVGALLPADVSRPCVTASLAASDARPARVSTTARLGPPQRPVTVQLPNYAAGADALYSGDDCRLLALPLFHGAALSWTN